MSSYSIGILCCVSWHTANTSRKDSAKNETTLEWTHLASATADIGPRGALRGGVIRLFPGLILAFPGGEGYLSFINRGMK